jgi:tRNA uridine 5-carboxymethylaminomethyl modification enzyme
MRSVDFDVIVIGAGHAGVEAAWAAARMGRTVALCTLTKGTVAQMPCNPAIGGTAKGHLVREIDALGGVMGTAIDATGIQFKLLNRSRGPAVWSPRAQADKRRYTRWVTDILGQCPEIEWLFVKVSRILADSGGVRGVEVEDGRRFTCWSLVVTTGTFLNGLIHIGPEQRPAGRAGSPRRVSLPSRSRASGFAGGG